MYGTFVDTQEKRRSVLYLSMKLCTCYRPWLLSFPLFFSKDEPLPIFCVSSFSRSSFGSLVPSSHNFSLESLLLLETILNEIFVFLGSSDWSCLTNLKSGT